MRRAYEARVTVLGGGVWVAALCEQLAATLTLQRLDIRLAARDRTRVGTIAAHAAKRTARYKPLWRVAAAAVPAALEDADVVVALLRAGGAEARQRDESFPRAFGFVGDEGLGLGGFANALRTLPVLERLAEKISERAPGATVLNLVAPLGLTTKAFLERGLDAFGICELPLMTERMIGAALGLPFGALDYAGLNHVGWFWPKAAPFVDADTDGLHRAGIADPETIGTYGAIPLKYFYRVFDEAKAKSLGLAAKEGRAGHLGGLANRILVAMTDAPGASISAMAERDMPWFADALVPALAAFLEHRAWEGIVNGRNGNLLPALSPDCVVELRCRFNGGGAQLRPPETPVPATAERFMVAGAEAERLIWLSHLNGRDPGPVAEAIRRLPGAAARGDLADMAAAVVAAAEVVGGHNRST